MYFSSKEKLSRGVQILDIRSGQLNFVIFSQNTTNSFIINLYIWQHVSALSQNMLPDLQIDNKTICCVLTEYNNIYLICVLDNTTGWPQSKLNFE